MQYCAQPGCSHLVARGRCAMHANQYDQGRRDQVVQRWYYTVRWKRLRALVLRTCAYQCQACGQVQHQLEVDHIRPHHGNRALFWDARNLQALCAACHTRKTMRDTQAGAPPHRKSAETRGGLAP